ncbi:MAG TPA: ABC transporter permease, partial [Vicinamibacterales bacterium]|nr:ABC transporter permease [Vicinamibacterales bacterium]
MNALSRLLVRLSAFVVPKELRSRWREEWLGELTSHPSAIRAIGAPWDAMVARGVAIARAARDLAAGCGADTRQSLRAIAHEPGHAAAVVLCLAVGMTVSVGVFSLLNSLLYGDIPGVVDRTTLARFFVSYEDAFGTEHMGREQGVLSATSPAVSDFDVLEATPNGALTGLAAEGGVRLGVSLEGRSAAATAAFVSRDYFATLRTPAHAGRLLTPMDQGPGAAPVAVIGYHLWQERFDGRADIVGRTLLAGSLGVTIVGIAPPRFTGIQPSDIGISPLNYAQLWLPLTLASQWPGTPDRDAAWLNVVGRLAGGATQDDVRAQTAAAASRLSALRPDARKQARFILRSHGFGPRDSPVQVLIILVLFMSVPLTVLAIACANVANLQLARSTRRSREIAVRLALGASRLQIVRLLTLEALTLAAAAGFVGLLGADLALTWAQPMFPLMLGVDARVVGFALVITGGATLLSGLAPAWLASRRQVAVDLRQTAQSGGLAHARMRSLLVVMQIALSLALLTMCGLFTRSAVVVAGAVPPQLKEIAQASLDVSSFNGTAADSARLQRDVMARLSADPRVRAAGLADMSGFRYRPDRGSTEERYIDGGSVSDRWFEATGARLRAGRAFTAVDRADVAVVNPRLAREIAGDDSALGRVLHIRSGEAPPSPVTIVGIVDPPPNSPFDDNRKLYVPLIAAPSTASLVVRGDDGAAALASAREAVSAAEPRLMWIPIGAADAAYMAGAGELTILAVSIGTFGAIALSLAAAGLFAMVAYVVSMRMRELGIRAALGARSGDLVGLVVRQAARLAAWGAAVGLAIALPLAFALRSLFLGTSPLDPIAVLPPLGLLLAVAL